MQTPHQYIDQYGQAVDQVELLKNKAHLRTNAAYIIGNTTITLDAQTIDFNQ